jgi:putative nucleotidyltransferase with HDIG domain
MNMAAIDVEASARSIGVTDLIERVGNIFAAPEYMPPMLPTVAIELLHVARYPDIDLRRIARLVAADPMLAGRVMSLVNSPVYAGTVPIRTLDQAVFRIGLNSLRDLVVQAALNMRLFTTDGYTTSMERVRRHSVATAHVSRVVANHTGSDSEIAFLDGLLHDVGIAAALIVIDELFVDQTRPRLSAIWPAVQAIHESAGLFLARIWDLPADLSTVIGRHHDFQQGGSASVRIARLHIAETIASKLGRGIVTGRRLDGRRVMADLIAPEITAEARRSLGIDRSTLATIFIESREALDTLR